MEAFNVGQVDYSVSRIQRQCRSEDTVSEERAKFSSSKLQLIDGPLAIIGYKQVVDRSVIKRPCNTRRVISAGDKLQYSAISTAPATWLSVLIKTTRLKYNAINSSGARILEQVGPAAGPKVEW